MYRRYSRELLKIPKHVQLSLTQPVSAFTAIWTVMNQTERAAYRKITFVAQLYM